MRRGMREKRANKSVGTISKKYDSNKSNKLVYILLALLLVLAVCACFFIITKITGDSIITGDAIFGSRNTLLFQCYDSDIDYHDPLGTEFTPSYAQVKFLWIIPIETKYDKKVGDTLSEAYCISPTRNTVSYKEGIDCGGKFKRDDVNGNNEAWACCTSRCVGKICGSDGCEGGSCGNCTIGECNAAGTACLCTPDCTGKKCGSDGCEGSCGNCTFPNTCNANGACVCIPSCEGKECGTAGCGSSENCGTLGGTCTTGECNKGVCPPAPVNGSGGIVITSLDSSTSAQIPASAQISGPWELSASSRKALTTTQNPAAFLNLTNGTYRVTVNPDGRYANYTNNHVIVTLGQTKVVTPEFNLLPNYVLLEIHCANGGGFKVDKDGCSNVTFCTADCSMDGTACRFDNIISSPQTISFTGFNPGFTGDSYAPRQFTFSVNPGDGTPEAGWAEPREVHVGWSGKSGGEIGNINSCSDLLNGDDCTNSLNWENNDNVLGEIERNYPYANAPADFCTGEPYSEILITYPNCRQTIKCGCVWDVVGGCVGSVWPVYTNLTAGGCGNLT